MSVSSGFVVHTGGHVLGVTALQPFGCLNVSQGDGSGVVIVGGGVLVAFFVLVLCNAWLVVRFSQRFETFWRRGGE